MQIDNLREIFKYALKSLGIVTDKDINFEIPKNLDHGDLSSNLAMTLTKELKRPPRDIAQSIIDNLVYDKELVESVTIAGPGFINIKFSNENYRRDYQKVILEGDDYGRSDAGKGQKLNVEYVSVNPTGLLHLGHGRNAAIGDTIANLYQWQGWDVTREYYFNNAGNQMNNLAKSIYARYRQQLGEADFPFPEDGYHGGYINDIAIELIDKVGKKYYEENEENLFAIRKFGEDWCFKQIKKTLERMNISQDVFYNEDSLYSQGKIEEVIEILTKKELVYEKDGAKWLALSKMGLEDDRVIVKSTGEPTYRLPDIAYHREKFQRGFDLMIDVFGSDHIATVPDVLAAIKELGYDETKVKVLVHQFVTLTEEGKQVKMSKRSGKVYTLDDLLDEVGEDVVRFFLIMRSMSTHLEFDLDLAREQSEKNPVYYLQYAHARICSVFDKAQKRSIDHTNADISVLDDKDEINLIKQILRFPDVLKSSCERNEPQYLPEYLRELASAFHVFYHNCRILGAADENQEKARLQLADSVRTIMKNGLTVLGISVPERM
jgi:arginyl-tRNA synthetase